MSKMEIIKKYAQEEETRLLLARVLDKLEESEQKNIAKSTKFLNEAQRALVEKVIANIGNPRCSFFGGYEGASRTVLTFLPDYLEPEQVKETETDNNPLAFIRAEYKSEKALSHRDFLGSLMGVGIQRETVGDILVGEGSCDIVVLKEILPYLLNNFAAVGRVRVETTVITAEKLRIPEEKFILVKDTVASLRLDNVVAAGFRISREKASEHIKAGRVMLNHLGYSKADRLIPEGDVITLRGMGKIKLEEVGHRTRKGRIAISIKKYM